MVLEAQVKTLRESVEKKPLTWLMVSAVFGAFCLFLVLLISGALSSDFTNSPNSIRRYVVAEDGLSLDDKLNRSNKSGLTGTRDVPVFFSDFNVEMTRDANGDLVPQRESFENDKANEVANIEQRFMVN